MSDLGSLVISLEANMAKFESDLGKAVRTVENVSKQMAVNFGSLESAINRTKTAALDLSKGLLIGAAAGASIDTITNKIQSTIDSMAHLKEVSEKTGSSVESLSKLSFFAKSTGTDIDAIAGAMAKLSKGMVGADEEGKGAGQAMSFLGLSAKNAAGNLKDPADMLGEIAKKLDDYQDGAGKAAVAQALFGKSGADMLPTLKMLAEQGDIAAKVTTQQAEAARQYTKDMAKLEAQKQALFKTLTVALLPTMTDFANVMLDAAKNTDSASTAAKKMADDHTLSEWADDTAMGVSRLIDVIKIVPALVSAVAGSFKVVWADVKVAGAAAMLNPASMAISFAKGENPLEDFRATLDERNKTLAEANQKYDDLWNMDGAATEKAMAAKIAARKAEQDFMQNADARDLAMLSQKATKTKEILNFSTAKESAPGAETFASTFATLGGEAAKLDQMRVSLASYQDASEHAKRAEVEFQVTMGKWSEYTEPQKARLLDLAVKIDRLTNRNKLLTESMAMRNDANKAEREAAEVMQGGANAVNFYSEALAKLRDGKLKNLSDTEQEAYIQNAYNAMIGDSNRSIAKMIDTIKQGTTATLSDMDSQQKDAIAAKYNTEERTKLALATMNGSEAYKSAAIAAAQYADAINKVSDASKLGLDLEQQIKTLNAEMYIDDKGAAEAKLKLEVDRWQKTIDMARTANQALIDAQYEYVDATLIANQAALDRSAQALKDYIAKVHDKNNFDDFKRMWGSVESTAHDTFVNIFNTGDDTFKRLRDSLKNGLVELLYQLTLRKWIINIGAEISGSGGSGGILGTASNSLGLYNNLTNVPGLYNGVMGLFGSAGTMGAIGASGITAGTLGAAEGMSLLGSETGLGFAASGLGAAEGLSLVGTGSSLGLTAGALGEAGVGSAIAGAGGATAAGGLSAALAAVPGWGWALGAAALLGGSSLFDDGDSPTSSLTFGSNNKAGNLNVNHGGNKFGASGPYISDGGGDNGAMASVNTSFGSYGVVGTYWASAMSQYRSGLDQYLALVAASDKVIADKLSPDQIKSVSDKLSAHAFEVGTGPEHTDPSTLGSYNKALADRVKSVLDAVDSSLDKFVKDFQGPATALTDEVAKLIDLKQHLMDYSSVFHDAFSLDDIDKLKQSGENVTAAFSRLVTMFQTTDAVAKSLGKDIDTAFGAVGLASDAARERLVSLAGGLDALQQSTAYFAQNFLSDAERLAPIEKSVNDSLAALGYTGITTRGQFKEIVEGLNLATEAGAKTYAALLHLAPAFAQMTDLAASAQQQATDAITKAQGTSAQAVKQSVDTAFSELGRAVDAEKNRLQSIYDAQIKAIRDQADAARKMADGQLQAANTSLQSIKGVFDSLNSALSTAMPMTRDMAQGVLQSALAYSNSGGSLANYAGLGDALQAVTRPTEDMYASLLDFQRDQAKTANTLQALRDNAGAQVSVAQMTVDAINKTIETIDATAKAQLDALDAQHTDDVARLDALVASAQAQIDAINGVDNSVKDLATVINNFNAASKTAGGGAINSAAGAAYGGLGSPGGGAGWMNNDAYNHPSGVSVSPADSALLAAAKLVYQSATGGVSTAQFDAASAAVGGDIYKATRWNGDPESFRKMYSFDVGTNLVPHDMVAQIHAGERIIPAADNKELMARLRVPQGANGAMAEDIRQLRQENAALRAELNAAMIAVAQNTSETARWLRRWNGDGMPETRVLS